MLGDYSVVIALELQAVIKGRYLVFVPVGILVDQTGDAVPTVHTRVADLGGDIGFRILAVLALRPDEADLARLAFIAFFTYYKCSGMQVLAQLDNQITVFIYFGAHVFAAVLDFFAGTVVDCLPFALDGQGIGLFLCSRPAVASQGVFP